MPSHRIALICITLCLWIMGSLVTIRYQDESRFLSPISSLFHSVNTPLSDEISRFFSLISYSVSQYFPTKNTTQHAPVMILWIDDMALREPSLGGFGRLSDWDRSLYVKLINALGDKGISGLALDILLTPNGRNDTLLVNALQTAQYPISLARTHQADGVVSSVFLTGAQEAGWVDLLRRQGNFGDRVIALQDGRESLTSVLTGSTLNPNFFYARSDIPEFHYDNMLVASPDVEGMSVLCVVGTQEQKWPLICPVNRIGPQTYVILATNASAMNDSVLTNYGWVDGGLIHAWYLNSRLEGVYGRALHPSIEIAYAFLVMSSFAFIICFLRRRMLVCLGIWGVLFLLSICMTFYWNIFFVALGWWFFCIGVIFFYGVVLRMIGDYKRDLYLRGLLGVYVAPEIARALRSGNECDFPLSQKHVVAFFSDIEGFTSFSECLPPEKLRMFLDWYLDGVSAILLRHGAYIDKFIGDGVMALWGAFPSGRDTSSPEILCQKALLASGEIVRLFSDNSSYLLGLIGVSPQIRIGLSYGEALVGSIGSPNKKQSYTAMGSAINTASRIEGANKFYQTSILTDEQFARYIPPDNLTPWDCIYLKGKHQMSTLWAPISSCSPAVKPWECFYQAFHRDQAQDKATLKDLLLPLKPFLPERTYSLYMERIEEGQISQKHIFHPLSK